LKSDALAAERELLPTIVRLRDDTERDRRLAAPIVDGLRASGLGRIALERKLHGLELPPADALEVLELLAGAEASVAWIVWNNAFPCFFARYLAPAAREEIFGDPRWLYAGSTRPTGRASVEPGGYRVHGQWSLVSGCELAEWLLLMCAVEEQGEPRMLAPGVPELRLLFVRRGEFEILDTWHTGGMRGTGSHDVVVAGKHVPQHHTVFPGDGVQLAGPLGRLPIICTMAAWYGAQLLGIARSALDALAGLTRTKVQVDPGPGLGDRPAVLAALASRGASVAAARGHLRASVSELWSAVCAGPATLEGITAAWTAAHHAADQGRSAVEAMYAAGGTSSLYTSCPLERAHRDLHAMSRHLVAQPLWMEDAGRVLLEKKPTHPLYAI
jgi:alkylation response protein AidB-like acyl-CoA dehydrogenase